MQGKKPCRHEGSDMLYQSDERKKPMTKNTLLAGYYSYLKER